MQRRLEGTFTIDHYDQSKDHGNCCGYVVTLAMLGSTTLMTGIEGDLRRAFASAFEGFVSGLASDQFEMIAHVVGPDGWEDD